MTISASGLSFAAQPPFAGLDVIRASWRRCLTEYKLDPSDRRCVEQIPLGAENVSHSEIAACLGASSTILDKIRKVACDANRIVLLANADGVIVSRHADSPIAREMLQEGFAIGSILHEQRVGTNGVGTCIAARQAITVHADAHFNETFRGFTCSAAPIFASDGSVLAAVDISGRLNTGSVEGLLAQHFIREAAQNISLLVFKNRHKSDCIITLSRAGTSNLPAPPALIATDEAGRILGATSEGYSCLGVSDLNALGRRSLADLCEGNLADLKPLSRQAVKILTPQGTVAYATTFMTKKASAISSRTAKPADIEPKAKPLDLVAGNDAAMLEIVRLCRKVAGCDLPLLLLGETGTGKDTLARAIHAESCRAQKPYIAVNCAAIPATLLASELFGYAPGTFTGGIKGGKAGKIAASHEGTLFLDEIGDMPLDLQAHLLHVLEERCVIPLGATTPIRVDMKIICATHRDLPSLVAQGRFRQDLYYRIRGIQFTLPALRERTDIEALLAVMIRDEANALGHQPAGVCPSVLALFRAYTWPGNLREFRNVVRYVLSMLGDEREIKAGHLPDHLLQFIHDHAAAKDADGEALIKFASNEPSGSMPNVTRSADESLQGTGTSAERQLILETLRTHTWNVTQAAMSLGISRSTLHRKLRRYAITAPKHQSST